jgi:DNA-binding CsgD family transcriptional regulator
MRRGETADALNSFMEDVRDESPQGVVVLPWGMAGMGLLIAWRCCTHLPGCYIYATAQPQAHDAVDFAMRVGDIGTFLLVLLAAGRARGLLARPGFQLGSALACGLFTGAAALAADLGAAVWLCAALALVAGSAGALLFLLWAEVYGRLGPSRCLLYGSVSCLVAGAVSLVVSQLAPVASACAVALLPPVAGLLGVVALSRLPRAQQAASPAPRYPVPWKLVGLMAFAGFGSGFAGSLLVADQSVGAEHRILATTLFGLVLLAVYVLRRGSVDVRFLAWFTLPVALVSLAAIPLAGQDHGVFVSFLVKFSYVSFSLFVLLVLANVVYRYDVPAARVFAAARASSEGAMLAGIALRRWMRQSGALDSQTMLWVIALVGVLAVLGCVLLWHSERSVTSDWGTQGVDPASGRRVPSERELLLGRCAARAEEAGLTPREAEIFELVAQGLDPAQIEQALFLSHNTLKTHLRHIYAKLGTHTRAETVALVAGERPATQPPASSPPAR